VSRWFAQPASVSASVSASALVRRRRRRRRRRSKVVECRSLALVDWLTVRRLLPSALFRILLDQTQARRENKTIQLATQNRYRLKIDLIAAR